MSKGNSLEIRQSPSRPSSPEGNKFSAIKKKSKEFAQKLSKKLKRFKGQRANAGLRQLAEGGINKKEKAKGSTKSGERWKKGQDRVKKWSEKRSERKFKRKVLKGIETSSKLEKGKHEGPNSWKNATKRREGFFGIVRSRELTQEAKALAKSHSEDIQKKLGPDHSKLSRSEQRKNYATAVNDLYREKFGESASQMFKETREDPAFKQKLQERINAKMADKSGEALTQKQKNRVEKKLLREEVKTKLDSQHKDTAKPEEIKTGEDNKDKEGKQEGEVDKEKKTLEEENNELKKENQELKGKIEEIKKKLEKQIEETKDKDKLSILQALLVAIGVIIGSSVEGAKETMEKQADQK